MRKERSAAVFHRSPSQAEPRTGVGTPDARAEAGGAGLGGTTGDVDTPQPPIGGSVRGTAGATANPEASTVSKSPGRLEHTVAPKGTKRLQ
ncbi:MAG: hypothetical protein ACYC7E_01295 [Armatimonadota bacterium]